MSKATQSSEHNTDLPGSPNPGEPVYLAVGKLRRSHGVKGEILFEMTSEQPGNMKLGQQLYIGEHRTPVTIASIRPTDKLWLIAFAGFTTNESVEIFRNQIVYGKKDQLPPLPNGRFYHHEVIGMQVEDEQHINLGVVIEILVTGANDVYVVKTLGGSEMLVPAVRSVILKMDRETRMITIRPQEWN